MVLFLYTKEISPVIGEKGNVIDLKMHSKQCIEYSPSFILKEIVVCEMNYFSTVPKEVIMKIIHYQCHTSDLFITREFY